MTSILTIKLNGQYNYLNLKFDIDRPSKKQKISSNITKKLTVDIKETYNKVKPILSKYLKNLIEFIKQVNNTSFLDLTFSTLLLIQFTDEISSESKKNI